MFVDWLSFDNVYISDEDWEICQVDSIITMQNVSYMKIEHSIKSTKEESIKCFTVVMLIHLWDTKYLVSFHLLLLFLSKK